MLMKLPPLLPILSHSIDNVSVKTKKADNDEFKFQRNTTKSLIISLRCFLKDIFDEKYKFLDDE